MDTQTPPGNRIDPLRRFWLRDAMRELAEEARERLGERPRTAQREREAAPGRS